MQQPAYHVPGNWVVLPAVAEAMDDDSLSKDEAMAMLRQFVSEQPPSQTMAETLERLDAEDDELTFREMLGAECLRLIELDG